jgi:hypothetical protein
MAFNSVTYANGLLTLPTSVAHPSFSHAAAWTKEGSGHSLVTRNSRDDLVGVLVGKISDHRLFCNPMGNYRPDSRFSTDFSNTKFQFTVGIPEEQVLVPVFRNAVANLLKIQKAISTTNDNKYLLEDDGDLTSVRFSMKMFEKRVSNHAKNLSYRKKLYHLSFVLKPINVLDHRVFLSDIEAPDGHMPRNSNGTTSFFISLFII